ncbi:MAG: type II CRISPR RNA-guided endonuclease Cas9 [Bradyrhizobiaceae bacterium]|nr:type II CRISPR RNA-guided endonuclease Cas9 [Bradyrhizobiaceae bacterium]
MGETVRVLGLDVGIASCGWGGIQVGDNSGQVIGAGVRTFDAPLVDKTGEPKSAERRRARGQRRVIRRRTQRMNAIRKLLHEADLLPNANSDALGQALRRVSPLGQPQVTPWNLRASAHDRPLTDDELAVVLGHIARHRGFRSNSKREAGNNAADETSKMKKAMEETREGLAIYRSFGDMMANDPKFADRKRNRDKDYSHTAKRSDLEDEVCAIFRAQRRLQNTCAGEDLEHRFLDKAFSQRPLQDGEKLLGNCLFEPDQKRTSKRAPSFELFRFLQRLANLRIAVGRSERPLTPEEIGVILKKFGNQKSYTYKTLRNDLDLDPNARFSTVARAKEGQDIAARKGQSAYGTCVLRETLGAAPWQSLQRTPEKLDRIAEIVTFREDLASIRNGLSELGLDEIVLATLTEAASKGAFTEFSGAAHISAVAARNLIPGLREGLVYSDACARIGYDHTARPAVPIEEIGSPVTRRALSEALKQVREVEREYGPFDLVHIELARDVGKSAEERRKITDGIEERNAEKERLRNQAADLLQRAISDDELLRYELAKELNFKCPYCDGAINPLGYAANDTRWQVDHILPWSRFGDDSFLNKTLCCTKCNQDKRGKTPFEWFESGKSEQEWELFAARIEGLKEMKGLKKRNFKLCDAAEIEEKFKERNLSDTKWVARLLADELKRMFPAPEGKRRVFTRPGAITSKLRRAWGLESTKKENGKRIPDDRHHAVDALVLAATTESLLLRMTKDVQKREKEGRTDDIFHVQQPWPSFRQDVMSAVYGDNGAGGVFISRAERRRARGKAHDATVKQIREINGERVVFERRPIEKLTEKDLERIPIPEPYGKIADPKKLRDELVASLRSWIASGKPKTADRLPRSPKGDIIRKVRLATKDRVSVELSGGTVDRGDMARVDVFRKQSKQGRWEFYVVPIYPHQIVQMDHPPMQAVKGGGGDEKDWPTLDGTAEFLWSMYPMTFLELVKSDGEMIEGYFRSLDRNTGAITVSPQTTSAAIRKGIGVKTLTSFRKFSVDRLGRKFEVKRELRTWRGRVCT